MEGPLYAYLVNQINNFYTIAMASFGAILLNDLQGAKLDDGTISAIRKFVTGTPPYTPTNVLRGELLSEIKKELPFFNYVLYRDPNICLQCNENDVTSLTREEFLLLEAIMRPLDRLDAFTNKKLKYGVQLKLKSIVYVTLPEDHSSSPREAVVRYKGEIDTLRGIFFGVEILVRSSDIYCIVSLHIGLLAMAYM